MASGLRTHLQGDIRMANVIATRDVIVHDPNLDIDRKVFAGQAVPPDLVDAYREQTGETSPDEDAAQLEADRRGAALGTGTSTGTAPDTPASTGYEGQPVDDLRAEADRRGLTVDGTGTDGKVLKSDLVAALKADDSK